MQISNMQMRYEYKVLHISKALIEIFHLVPHSWRLNNYFITKCWKRDIKKSSKIKGGNLKKLDFSRIWRVISLVSQDKKLLNTLRYFHAKGILCIRERTVKNHLTHPLHWKEFRIELAFRNFSTIIQKA